MKKEELPLKNIFVEILSGINPRTQDILKKRFGLADGQAQTLEAIGQKYNITRERIRQIEVYGLKIVKINVSKSTDFKVFSETAKQLLETQGAIAPLDKFVKKIQDTVRVQTYPSAILFLLKLSPDFSFLPESKNRYEIVSLKNSLSEQALNFLNAIEKELSNANKAMEMSDIVKLAQKNYNTISQNNINNYLELSKIIAANPFGEYGLRYWQDIEPKGAKDKAYLIMKHKKTPMHFTEIAHTINEGGEYEIARATSPNLWLKSIKLQTIHNELIKDPRFVLIGRGIYALNDWGYKPGTVKDVIVEIFKKVKKPLSKDEIIALVAKQKIVQSNTIILNLQDKAIFGKDKNKKYFLKTI